MIKPLCDNVHGLWKVTTEGGREGRFSLDLGTYEGYIDEIAFALADKCYYSLTFSAVDPHALKSDMTPKRKTVDIRLDIGSGTWDMKPEDRATEVSSLMRDRPVAVSESAFYGCVKLTANKKAKESG